MNCISRNCLLLVVLTCLFPFFVFAEIPAGYDIMMMLLEKAVRICKKVCLPS